MPTSVAFDISICRPISQTAGQRVVVNIARPGRSRRNCLTPCLRTYQPTNTSLCMCGMICVAQGPCLCFGLVGLALVSWCHTLESKPPIVSGQVDGASRHSAFAAICCPVSQYSQGFGELGFPSLEGQCWHVRQVSNLSWTSVPVYIIAVDTNEFTDAWLTPCQLYLGLLQE